MKKTILSILIATTLALSAQAKSLVVYFSVSESTKTSGLTRNEDNSLVVIGGKALGNVQTITSLEKNATFEKNAFTESRDTIDSCRSRVIAWLRKIGVKK